MRDISVDNGNENSITDKNKKYKCKCCGMEWYVYENDKNLTLLCDYCQGELEKLKK